jgi:hypothetical protein
MTKPTQLHAIQRERKRERERERERERVYIHACFLTWVELERPFPTDL